MSDISVQPVKGTRDFYPEDLRLRSWLFGHWRAVAAQFGYEEYDACVLESEELYIRKAGDEITGQLYNFEDKGGRRVALRPEMTPTLARMVIAKGGSVALPLRWYSIPQCFRYERMQRGRKREHFQWNMDCIGLETVAAEIELMSAQAALLGRLGFDPAADVVFKVSHRQVLQGYLADLGIDGEAFAAVCIIVDKRDKIGREATAEMLAEQGVDGATATKVLDLLEITGLEQLQATVGAENPGYLALAELMTLAAAAGIAGCIQIDCSVVRGLSYYTGTVWELFASAGELTRAIAGGGRYDALMEHLGGNPTPMVGFGFGDVVILELLKEKGLLPALGKQVDDVVYPMDSALFATATAIASKLRAQGRQVSVDYTGRRFKHVIKAAENDGAERLFILGKSEAEKGVVKVRRMANREESELSLDSL